MTWLELNEDRIKELLAEDYYPSLRSIHTKEAGTIRRFRAECRTGYYNTEKYNDHDECCPGFVGSPPKLESDKDLTYHPISPKEFLGDTPDRTRLFLAQLTEEMDYIAHLKNKDGENIRPDIRKPIEATPIQTPIVSKKRSGDWVGFAHWQEGGAFFSSWGHPVTEPEDPMEIRSRPYRKEFHFSLDIVTKDHLFYRFDIEQYIVNIWGIWQRMYRPDYDLDRDGPDSPTHSRGFARGATATVTIVDYSELNVGDKVILRATKAPTKDIHFNVATDGTGWNPGSSNNEAALALATLINANENFIAEEYYNVVKIEQSVQGKDGETEIELVDSHIQGMTKTNFTMKNEDQCMPTRKQNLGISPEPPLQDGSVRHPQCRIWDMETTWSEWVNGKAVY